MYLLLWLHKMANAKRGISIGIAAIVVIGIILIAGFGIYLGDTFGTSSTTSSLTSTNSDSTTTAKKPATQTCEVATSAVVKNGTTFCTDDVTNDTVVQNPGGYTYFRNNSIIFMGINFTTICPQGFYGCPGTSNNSEVTTMAAGALRVNLTFPDKTIESLGGIIGINYNLTLLSTHTNPRAGIMLLDTRSGYEVYLLVQPVATTSTVCSISGQPAGIEFRIIYDVNSTPVIGAKVYATNKPALCGNAPATTQSTTTITTTGNEWYSLPSDNNAGYSFIVSYSGQNYTFSSNLQPVSMTCATLFVPSGKTNMTITEFSSTCETTTTSTSSIALPAICPPMQSYTGGFQVTSGTSSPAVICLQLYYYSQNALTLNLSNVLTIQAIYYIQNGSIGIPRSFSGSPNFTVTPSQSQIVLGGPSNENEGIVVAFSIVSNAGASGTYEVGIFGSPALDHWMLGSEPEQCGYYGELIAGNGQPNYAQPAFNGCITYTVTSGNSTESTSSISLYHTVPGIPYQLVNGDLYFRIVGVTNATQ